MKNYEVLGIEYLLDENDKNWIKKNRKIAGVKRKGPEKNLVDLSENKVNKMNELIVNQDFDDIEIIPPRKRSKISQELVNESPKLAKENGNNKNKFKKVVKFVWTRNRACYLVHCVVDGTFFIGLPKEHDKIAKEILTDLIELDSAFKKIDYKMVKKKLYALQSKVINIKDESKLSDEKQHIQQLYNHFKINKISLQDRIHTQDSDGL